MQHWNMRMTIGVAALVMMSATPDVNAAYTGLAVDSVDTSGFPGFPPASLHVFRVFAEFDGTSAADGVLSVFGDTANTMELATDSSLTPGVLTSFVNNIKAFGPINTPPNPLFLPQPGFESLNWDTWVTIGLDTSVNNSVILSTAFGTETNNLSQSFTTNNASWSIDPLLSTGNQHLGSNNGNRVLLMQLATLDDHVFGTINLEFTSGTIINDGFGVAGAAGSGSIFAMQRTFDSNPIPSPGILPVLFLGFMTTRRRRKP